MRSPKEKKPFSNSRKRSKFKNHQLAGNTNNILRNRGRIDLMISKEFRRELVRTKTTTIKKRGGQRRYSDQAILVCLQIILIA